MNNMKMYCMCLDDHHLNNLKKLNYIPVALGDRNFSKDWLRDNSGENISFKNKYYGEYSFYYWFWKNALPHIEDNTWIGFCGYRYHWSNQNIIKSDTLNIKVNSKNFDSLILKNVPKEWENKDVILGDEIFVDKWKINKIVKRGMKTFLMNPFSFIKKNHSVKLHFDVFHGHGNLDRAIDLLDDINKEEFRNFTREKKSFNRENLFICRSKKLIDGYFSSVFPWLEKCEKIFGLELEGYSMTRIYAFLAERYLSYWFNKHAKPLTWPIFFYDTNKNKMKL